MNGKFILLMVGVIFLISMTVVSAEDNATSVAQADAGDDAVSAACQEPVEKTVFNDYDTHEQYSDSRVIVHNVVKYYGDKATKFEVEVHDSNGNPQKDAEVSFSTLSGSSKTKYTGAGGTVSFPVNYKVGKHLVTTLVQLKGVNGDWNSENYVTIKSTISPKEMVKFSSSKQKFKITFLDSKGKPLKNKYVKLTILGKAHKVKTNSRGIVKIKSTGFKAGKTVIKAYNPVSGEKRNLLVVVLKKGIHKVSVRIDDPTGDAFPKKSLKNGDNVNTRYESKGSAKERGVYLQFMRGSSGAKHTKVLKVKVFFKNKKTGNVIVKTRTKVVGDVLFVKQVKGYSPFKASVWFKHKK